MFHKLLTCCSLVSIALTISANESQKKDTKEILTVQQYNGLHASLNSKVSAKLVGIPAKPKKFQSFNAGNNESGSLKKLKDTLSSAVLSCTAFENNFATNFTALTGPSGKNVQYEALSVLNKKLSPQKQYFSQTAFLDSNTLATIAYTRQEANLLFIDISGSQMTVNGSISIPAANPFSQPADFLNSKELFYIDRINNKIVLAVNQTKETIGKDGNLSWKKSKKTTPGLWIITPVKNDEKKWVPDPSRIAVYSFSNELAGNNLRIQTAHADTEGNIWMNFSKGIIGCLPVQKTTNTDVEYGESVPLYNFNKDAAWYSDMNRRYKELIYDKLKGMTDAETEDTSRLYRNYYHHPEAYGQQYLENAQYTLFSNLLKEKESLLDSNTVYENPDELLKYIHLELDEPTHKGKRKLTAYFGYKIRQFQTLHNGITSADNNCILAVTNLGLHKLHYNRNTESIVADWSTPYHNSFLKTSGNKAAASQTTPAFIKEKNEIVFCDNAFPQVNLLILDAKKGSLKYQFRLFESAYGSALNNAVTYSNNTIIAGNTFGNPATLSSKTTDYPAAGIMKFNCSETGTWMKDYEWNQLQKHTTSNTAAIKTAAGGKIYLYHQTPENQWQVSAIRTDKADHSHPIQFSLLPDFKNILKTSTGNFLSNYTFGPKKSLYIGTQSGILRIVTE